MKNQFMISGGSDKNVKMWSIGSGELVRTFSGHTACIKSLTMLPKDCIASGAMDRTIRLWDSSTGLSARVLTGHSGDVTALATLTNKNLITKDTIKI